MTADDADRVANAWTAFAKWTQEDGRNPAGMLWPSRLLSVSDHEVTVGVPPGRKLFLDESPEATALVTSFFTEFYAGVFGPAARGVQVRIVEDESLSSPSSS